MIKKVFITGVIITGLIGIKALAEQAQSADITNAAVQEPAPAAQMAETLPPDENNESNEAAPEHFLEKEVPGTGIMVIKDTYNKKVFVLEVATDSTAAAAGVPVGAEVLKINNERVRSLSAEDINTLLNQNNDSDVVILTKNNKEKTSYNLKYGKYTVVQEDDNRFLLYWNQIAPKNLYLKKIPDAVLIKLSTDYQDDILAKQAFWRKQKSHFQMGYDTCMTYPEQEQNTCLLNLVNTINSNINRNRQLNIKSGGVARQKDGIPIYNVNQIMLQNAFQNLGDRY